MNSVFIFSGTSEGRELSEYLSLHKIPNDVFVATEYGEVVMNTNEYTTIHKGRLDVSEMQQLFYREKPSLIVDATHPYAVEVTANIKDAVMAASFDDRYLRIIREAENDFHNVKKVLSTQEAVDYLKTTSGNILLTTGVKELDKYVNESNIKDRIFARILPGKESMEKVYSMDILPRRIIAMEGPFSTEMNLALINQFDISILVTKNSGQRGGYREKLDACEKAGIKALVIERDKLEDGVSLGKAKEYVLEKYGIKEPLSLKKNVSVVGVGMGTMDSLSVAGKVAIEKAHVLIGAKRMLEFGKTINCNAVTVEEYNNTKVEAVIEAMFLENSMTKIAVLVSGDTGFYSLAASLSDDYSYYPGISSFSYLSSKIKKPYSGADIKSFHGKNIDPAEINITADRCFCIFSGLNDMKKVVEANPEYKGYIGFNLGQSDEQIICFKDGHFNSDLTDGLYTLYFEKQ